MIMDIDLTADPSPVADDGQRQLLATWLRQVEAGEMPRWLLFEIRGRIDPACNEFPPRLPGLDDLRLAVMAALDVRPGDLDNEPPRDYVPGDWPR
jgi:hypothetical protein